VLVRDGFEAVKNRGVVSQQGLSQDSVAGGGAELANVGAGVAGSEVRAEMELRPQHDDCKEQTGQADGSAGTTHRRL